MSKFKLEGKTAIVTGGAGGIGTHISMTYAEAGANEVINLAADPAHKKQLTRMRNALSVWIADTGDKGQFPRSESSLREVIERYLRTGSRDPSSIDKPGRIFRQRRFAKGGRIWLGYLRA